MLVQKKTYFSGHLEIVWADSSNTVHVHTVPTLSKQFQFYPDTFNTVRQFQYCPENFNTVRKVLILSDSFNIAWTVVLELFGGYIGG